MEGFQLSILSQLLLHINIVQPSETQGLDAVFLSILSQLLQMIEAGAGAPTASSALPFNSFPVATQVHHDEARAVGGLSILSQLLPSPWLVASL